jgi:hypothetical protein
MDVTNFPELPPRRKPFKRLVNQIVMVVLGKALQSLSKHEPLIQHEALGWPENFTLMIVVRPDGGSMALTRLAGGKLAYRGTHFPEAQADVVIYMKNVESAFAMFTGQLGIDMGYAQHAMCARGDLSHTVSVVRVLNIAEAYLFPSLLARRLMKQLPPIPFGRKTALRLKAYLLGITFGL